VKLVLLVDPVRPSTEDVFAYIVANGSAAARVAALRRRVDGDFEQLMSQAEALDRYDVADLSPPWSGGLAEFTCEAFLASFDDLAAEAKASAGRIVGRTDSEVVERLARELASDSAARRRRALAAAAACETVDALLAPVLTALADSDPRIRVAAAEALATSRSPDAARALRNTLCDANIHVQLAAEWSLHELCREAPRGRGG
jgi:hypothetical protein